MGKVRILPDRVANQIAAGEVIERPAAVIKELVENALDAGATKIEVEFRVGGRALMAVEDNGSGMSRDDAMLALERHATSKIVEADDLNRLLSYGFRGEALPSIASVSRFQLQTRAASEDVGTEILINGGRMVHVRECGRAVGTRIEVAQLFNSVPARRKFLKSDQTEAAHIVQCVRLYALVRPNVAFTLIEDGRTVFRSPECTRFEERVEEIFGRQITESLVSLEVEESGMRLHGLIGRPGVGRATRHEMITFVNQRPVDSRTLNYALIESYQESLPKGRYPLAFVFFHLDPSAVDVNVHPAKREVRFRSESGVRGFVIRGVLQRLRELGAAAVAPSASLPAAIVGTPPGVAPAEVRAPSSPSQAVPKPTPLQQVGSVPTVSKGEGNGAVSLRVPSASEVNTSRPEVRSAPLIPPEPSRTQPLTPVEPQAVTKAPSSGAVTGKTVVPAWRYVGLAHGSYALFETASGLVLLDRRATHERIWFERLQGQFKRGEVPSQRLLLAVPLELDPVMSALLLDRLAFLNQHGFELSEFGRNFFRIEAVPAWMEPGDAESFLRDLLGAFREGRLQDRDLNLAREELARMASSRAVRLPPVQTESEIVALIGQLFATRAPLTSPGGKPTYIELNHGELARRFQK
ncbi:MAG TPA: DNA mismatch repair endonuclease MutL [Opitutaceae bacterium]|nr:DNA mismatch repair endonuclease MutL [Opitutaceae bacterium]